MDFGHLLAFGPPVELSEMAMERERESQKAIYTFFHSFLPLSLFVFSFSQYCPVAARSIWAMAAR
jgi:hypothetical protein